GGGEGQRGRGGQEEGRGEGGEEGGRARRHGKLDPRHQKHDQAYGRLAPADPGGSALPASLDPAHRTRAYRCPSRPISRGGPRMSETLKTAGFMLGAIALVVAASVTQPQPRTASIFNSESHPLFPPFCD